MSGSSTDPVISRSLDDIQTPDVIVEVDPEVAEHLGAYQEDALTRAEAYRSNSEQGGRRIMFESNDHIGRLSEVLVQQLERNAAPWQQPQQAGHGFMPYNPISGKPFRGVNAVTLATEAIERGHGYDNRWMTREQAEQVGARIRDDEVGATIRFWQFTFTDGQGQQARFEQPRAFNAVVFNAQQIDGLPVFEKGPIATLEERTAHVENIVQNSRATIVFGANGAGRSRYASDRDLITLQEPLDPADNLARRQIDIVHQLAHWTGPRLGRDVSHPPGSEGAAREELRTNIASLMLGDRLRIGWQPGNHVAYTEQWVDLLRKDPTEIFRAALSAEAIAQHIISLDRQRQKPELSQEQMQQLAHQANERESVEIKTPVVVHPDHPSLKTSDDRTYLAVPYTEKDDARTLGAQWDRKERAWFVPAGRDLAPFEAWLPAKGKIYIAPEADPRVEFKTALEQAGLILEGIPAMDGQIHRVPVQGGKRGARDGAYIGHLDGHPAGHVTNFLTGHKQNWKSTGTVQSLSARQKAALAAEAAQHRAEHARERQREAERVAQEVEAIWAAAAPATAHPYLAAKGIDAHGLRVGAPGETMLTTGRDGSEKTVNLEGKLLVPMRDPDGRLWSLQIIGADGLKQFIKGGRAEGMHHMIGEAGSPWPLHVVEGYATGASIHAATGHPVAVAFNAYNLGSIAQAYRDRDRERAIYIDGDNDHEKEQEIGPNGKPKENVGRKCAIAAAERVGGHALLPQFGAKDRGMSDWNDVHAKRGMEALRQELTAGMAIGQRRQLARERSISLKSRDRGRTLERAGIER